MTKIINGKMDIKTIDDGKNEKLFTEHYVNELIKKHKEEIKELENFRNLYEQQFRYMENFAKGL